MRVHSRKHENCRCQYAQLGSPRATQLSRDISWEQEIRLELKSEYRNLSQIGLALESDYRNFATTAQSENYNYPAVRVCPLGRDRFIEITTYGADEETKIMASSIFDVKKVEIYDSSRETDTTRRGVVTVGWVATAVQCWRELVWMSVSTTRPGPLMPELQNRKP